MLVFFFSLSLSLALAPLPPLPLETSGTIHTLGQAERRGEEMVVEGDGPATPPPPPFPPPPPAPAAAFCDNWRLLFHPHPSLPRAMRLCSIPS